jgi:translation initiation factor IF-2
VVAGCYVTDGRIVRGQSARVLRGREEVGGGRIDSLRHIREDRAEIAAGYECGIGVNGFSEWEEGDVIECFAVEQVERE